MNVDEESVLLELLNIHKKRLKSLEKCKETHNQLIEEQKTAISLLEKEIETIKQQNFE